MWDLIKGLAIAIGCGLALLAVVVGVIVVREFRQAMRDRER